LLRVDVNPATASAARTPQSRSPLTR
jgi:hypothetical protein